MRLREAASMSGNGVPFLQAQELPMVFGGEPVVLCGKMGDSETVTDDSTPLLAPRQPAAPRRRAFPMFAVLAAFLAVASCHRDGGQERISFPATPVLTIRSTWAVVKSPLLRVRVEATNKSAVLSHIRMGAVVEVIAKSDTEETVEDETAFWYRINYDGLKGWVFGSYLEVFDSRAKAEKFSEKLK
jgi:hypothetical protein